ncbi:hypothetical protein LZL87_011982 [Fusarium oxysporum]|nr:hypothetical protein LZL87_011982 [Fusarium oxysporum]
MAVFVPNDSMATLQPLLETEATSSASIGNVPMIGRSTRLDSASWNGALGGVGLVPFPGPNNTTMNFTVYRLSNGVLEDMGMKAAMWNGSSPFTAAQNLRPAFACATGNLSRYIEICHRIIWTGEAPKGIQSKGPANQSWMLGPGDSPPDVSNLGPYFDWNNGKNFTFLKHKIPELDLSISNYNGGRHCRNLTQPCPDTYLSARVTTNPGQTLTFGNLSTMIMAIQYLAANETWIQNRTTWEDTYFVYVGDAEAEVTSAEG